MAVKRHRSLVCQCICTEQNNLDKVAGIMWSYRHAGMQMVLHSCLMPLYIQESVYLIPDVSVNGYNLIACVSLECNCINGTELFAANVVDFLRYSDNGVLGLQHCQ